MRIPKDSWRRIQAVIKRYPDNCKLITEWEMEVLDADLKDKDPTAHKAILLQSAYAKRLQIEIDAVEDMLDRFTEEEQKVIRTRFWSGKNVVPYEYMFRCNYSMRAMQKIVHKAFKIVGIDIGELNPKRWRI